MIGADDLLSFPKSALLFVLRALWWLAWDLLVEGIGWTIGWVFYRALTFGRFPDFGVNEQENASYPLRLSVELTGLAILAVAIWLLSGHWPA